MWDGTVNTAVIGSRIQSLLEVTFLPNLFCSNTILASLPELSTLGKTRLFELQWRILRMILEVAYKELASGNLS